MKDVHDDFLNLIKNSDIERSLVNLSNSDTIVSSSTMSTWSEH